LRQFTRSDGAEVAAVHGHSSLRLGRHFRGSANEGRDMVPCSQRLAKHVAAEGSCCAKEDETWHGTFREAYDRWTMRATRPDGWRFGGERRAEGDGRVRCTRMSDRS
jgi:hypothetical protein